MLSKIHSIFWCLLTVLSLSGCIKNPKSTVAKMIFYPQPPATPRLQFLKSYSHASDVIRAKSKLKTLLFGKTEEDIPFIKPYGVACHSGKIYLVDIRGPGIHVLDPISGTYHIFGPSRFFLKPINIRFDSEGLAYVADTEKRAVFVFDGQEHYLRTLGDGEDMKPTDIAIRGDELYVCDIAHHEIVVLDKHSGKRLRTIGKPGYKPGELFHPTNIILDDQGNLYVSDTTNARIQKFDPSGRFLMAFGGMGDVQGKLIRPKGIALDRKNNLYVVDAAFQNVQIFDPGGRLLLFFGEPGNKPGNLNLPAQITVSYELASYFQQFADPAFHVEYIVLTTSQFGANKLNIYGFGHFGAASE